MPELPEVETVCRGLLPLLKDQTITRVYVGEKQLRSPWPPQFAATLTGRRITAIRRRAKFILMDMDNQHTWLVHLGMSGAFRHAPVSRWEDAKHDHLLLETAAGVCLAYNDPRRFGMMGWYRTSALPDAPPLKNLGPEPLEDNFTGQYLHRQASRHAIPVKVLLMNASVVTGVGNIYASESLFRAAIHPARAADSLSGAECERLVRSVRETLRIAIDAGGSTLRDYRTPHGELGCFQHQFSVYDKDKQPCPCGRAAVQRIVQAGRSTYFCPACQS
jgi:formamidopyrimidine-DNA glycosylase